MAPTKNPSPTFDKANDRHHIQLMESGKVSPAWVSDGSNVRKTKIVITLGPALMQGDRLREALKEADAVRLNASHGDPGTRAEALQKVRSLALEDRKSVV